MKKQDVDFNKLSHLAKLEVEQEKEVELNGQIEDILGYVGKLSELDIDTNVSSYINDEVNVLAEDSHKDISDKHRKELIEAFTDKKGEALQVPGVFNNV